MRRVFYILNKDGYPMKAKKTKNSVQCFHLISDIFHKQKFEKIPFFITPKYQKIFIGQDGTSLLVQIDPLKYIFIGSKIYSFQTKNPILSYQTPVGKNAFIYPFAVTKDRYYLLLQHVSIEKRKKVENPYLLRKQRKESIKNIKFYYE